MLVVLCTCPSDRADRIAEALVEKKVAACVNVTASVRSVYYWRQKLQRDEEALLVIKTTEAAWPALKKTLEVLHPYEIPEIIALPAVRANPDYHLWVEENLCTD
jgi:periplasmic divalent cation tolerance protein